MVSTGAVNLRSVESYGCRVDCTGSITKKLGTEAHLWNCGEWSHWLLIARLRYKGQFLGTFMNQPLWEFFQPNTSTPVSWVDAKNKRFAIFACDPDLRKQVVLDRATGLVWTRKAGMATAKNWLDCVTTCHETKMAGVYGWRLPSVEELSSLLEVRTGAPGPLPEDNPFVDVQLSDASYWTSTKHPDGHSAWFVNLTSAGCGLLGLGATGFAWMVRGPRSGSSER